MLGVISHLAHIVYIFMIARVHLNAFGFEWISGLRKWETCDCHFRVVAAIRSRSVFVFIDNTTPMCLHAAYLHRSRFINGFLFFGCEIAWMSRDGARRERVRVRERITAKIYTFCFDYFVFACIRLAYCNIDYDDGTDGTLTLNDNRNSSKHATDSLSHRFKVNEIDQIGRSLWWWTCGK